MKNFFHTPYNCGSTIIDTCKDAKVSMTEEGFTQLLTETASSGAYIIDYSIEHLHSKMNILAFITFLRNLFVTDYFINLWYVLSIMYGASKDVCLDNIFESYVNYFYSYVCTCTQDVVNLKAVSY